MNLYQGIVEDINDPLKLGRVRVRVFGLHSDDTSLIPTDTLPWATVMQPVTSASMSGIGFSATGLLQGSWVVLFFQDPDEQYPVVIGTVHGIPKDLSAQVTADEEQSFEYSDNEAPNEQNVLKDGVGQTVTDVSGEPIKVAPTVTVPAGKVDPNKLGSVSAKYESNGNPATINKYSSGGDRGGASYGAYQFASYLVAENTPTRPDITIAMTSSSPIKRFVKFAGITTLYGLSPATTAFDSAWKSWANADKISSLATQHKYIEQNYYQLAIAKLPSNITNRGVAVHEMIWSMSVQLGPSGAANKINTIAGSFDASVCDDIVIEKVYLSRIDTVKTDFKSSPTQWAGLISRFNSEKAQLIALAKTYQTGDCTKAADVTEEVKDKIEYRGTEKTVTKETVTTRKTATKGPRGFTDPEKKYPLYYNEADTNRLARGVVTGTVVERKRAEVISGAPAGDATITEPTTQYNTKYPHNKVYVTSSGHIIELDDTPGYERVHVYHKSGTFVEMYPDGKMVTKVKGTNTLIVNSDNNTIVLGDDNRSVAGNSNSTVEGNMRLIVNGNIDVSVLGNVDMNVTGNTTIKSTRIDLN